jgi:hypothetical protein
VKNMAAHIPHMPTRHVLSCRPRHPHKRQRVRQMCALQLLLRVEAHPCGRGADSEEARVRGKKGEGGGGEGGANEQGRLSSMYMKDDGQEGLDMP